MGKYIKLFLHFVSLAWMRGMEYRINFFLWTLVDIGWTVMDFVFFTALVSKTQVLGNWSLGESIVVVGLFRILVIPVWGWMYQCFRLIPRMISEGRLDLLLTKPINSQFLVSTREFSFVVFPSLAGGMVFIWYGFKMLNRFPTLEQFLLFIWLGFVSVILMYGVYFLTMATSLYFDRLDNIHHLFTAMYDAARYPKEIYSIVFQRIFTLIVPLTLMLAVPVDVLFGKAQWNWIVWFHLMALGFFILGQQIWSRGLKRYTSASS